MTSDVNTQVRDYTEFFVSSVEPVELAEVVTSERARPVESAGHGRGRSVEPRHGLRAAVAAGVVGLLIGAVAWLTGGGGSEQDVINQTTAPPPTTTPMLTTTVTEGATQILGSIGVEVTWTEVEPGVEEGLDPDFEFPGVLLAWDGNGWSRSTDQGETWDRVLELDELTDVSIAGDGQRAVFTGTRSDGTKALLFTEDGETWSEVDLSSLPQTRRLELVETTRSGLTWFFPTEHDFLGPGPSDGVLAVIADGQLIDHHDLPWGANGDAGLAETTRGILAFQGSNPSYAWSYQGGGQWSQPVEIPTTDDRRLVGETFFMIDHANATRSGNPIPGESHWRFLTSKDGLDWTEVSTRAASTAYPPVADGNGGIHSLRLEAGESFLLYGPHIYSDTFEHTEIQLDNSTTLWISTDGTNWLPLDIPFEPPAGSDYGVVRADGDSILVSYESADGSWPIRWVGEVKIG